MEKSRSRYVAFGGAALLFAAVVIFTLVSSASASVGDNKPAGTIRGGVYQDFNGDGLCLADQPGERVAVPGIDVHFATDGASFTLYSGLNGTYGLIPVSAGAWQVRAMPNPDTWLVTSANPLEVEVSPGAGEVQLNVDFCLLRIDGRRLSSLPSSAFESASQAAASASATQPTTSATLQSQLEALGPVESQDPFVLRAVISEALMTNPPEPRPPENIEETLETPVDANEVPVAEWLTYLNRFRQIGGLSPLAESEALTFGSQWHSRYMVVNDTPIAHREDRNNPLFNAAGNQAAINGNLFVTPIVAADHTWATNFWISAPFHLVPIIDPGLGEVGYGQHNQDVGNFRMAGVLDVRSNLGNPPADVGYPLFFPGDGASTWVLRNSLYEWPDAMKSCSGYSRPSGPPLVLQLGDGTGTPRVSSHALYEDGQLIDSCRFDESTYSNPDRYAQAVGREILDQRDAVVIIPRRPLGVDKTYRVEVTANGEFYSWEFTTQRGP